MPVTNAFRRFAETLGAGVQNIFDVGLLFTAEPLGPRMSRSLKEIRADHAARLAELDAQHQALRERNRQRTVDYYLQRGIDRLAEQFPEHAAAVEREARRRACAESEPAPQSDTIITGVNGHTVTVQYTLNQQGE